MSSIPKFWKKRQNATESGRISARGRAFRSAARDALCHRLHDYHHGKLRSRGRQMRRREFIGILGRSEEHTSELQSRRDLVCRLLLEKKKKKKNKKTKKTKKRKTDRYAR